MLTKKSKGLRATGVGGVSCARHQMFRPLGMGDLQLGERYIGVPSFHMIGSTNGRVQAMQYGLPLDIVNHGLKAFHAHDIL